MSEGLKRQVRREELAMTIANGFHAESTLALVEELLTGKGVEIRHYGPDSSGFEQWRIDKYPSRKPRPAFHFVKGKKVEGKCPVCGGLEIGTLCGYCDE